MSSTYLTRATSDPQSSNTTATFSVWIKRSVLGSDQSIWSGSYYSTSNMFNIKFEDTDKVQILCNRGASEKANLKTNRLFRDTNAWYHFVFAIDSTQATASNRIKMYVNGVQETSFSTNTQPSQNENLYLDAGAGANYYIGQRGGSAQYFNGCMSHFHYVDGSQLAPTVFGSTDSTTGEWKINTSPSYTVGTKGFFVLKDGNSGTDQSANSNNFTVGGGTLTKTEDCPSNVFCTVNPLDNFYNSATLTNGNTTVATGSGNPSWNYITSTLGVSTGKWYWEVKDTTNNSSILGFAAKLTTSTGDQLGESSAQWGVQPNGRFRSAGSDLAGVGTFSFGQNDIVGIALDATNKKVYFHTNGTYGNSGNPSTGANGITIASPDVGGGFGWYFPAFGDGNTSSDTYHVNFGNGYFGTTAVSSAGTNASGIGIFEYDVPTGYTALSTKGLNL